MSYFLWTLFRIIDVPDSIKCLTMYAGLPMYAVSQKISRLFYFHDDFSKRCFSNCQIHNELFLYVDQKNCPILNLRRKIMKICLHLPESS